MNGKKLTKYAATLIIILFGVGAVVLLVDAAYNLDTKPEYADVDPTDINADYKW